MRKIFFIVGSLELGGTEKQIQIMSENLKKKFNLKIIIFHKKGTLYDKLKKNGVEIINLTSNKTFFLIKYCYVFLKFLQLLKNEKPDVVNFFLPQSYLIFGWASFFFKKINFIMSRRSLNDYQKKYSFIKFLEKILHKRMKYILTNSLAIKNQIVDDEGVSENKVKVIYNSIKINKNQKVFQEKKTVSIILIANLIPYKNHSLIITACSTLPKELNYRILFIGDGKKSYIAKLKKDIFNYNLEKRFEFCGKVLDTNHYLEKSDIGILCSNEEGLSNALIEYISYKLPVLATDVGGNSEIVKNNFNGFLVEKNNPESFAKKLEELINNKKLRKKFGNNGYIFAKQNFDLNKNLKIYENFFNDTINN